MESIHDNEAIRARRPRPAMSRSNDAAEVSGSLCELRDDYRNGLPAAVQDPLPNPAHDTVRQIDMDLLYWAVTSLAGTLRRVRSARRSLTQHHTHYTGLLTQYTEAPKAGRRLCAAKRLGTTHGLRPYFAVNG